jgi:membrane-bound lytic murein transglycosylase D
VLPADKVAVFLANLERRESEEKPLCVWHTRVLKKGERLDRVAAENGLTLANLKQINGIGPRTKVRPGFNLLVPDKGAAGVSALLLARLPVTPESAGPARGKRGKKGRGHARKKRGHK